MKGQIRSIIALCALTAGSYASPLFAEPTGGNVQVLQVRPYNVNGGIGAVYLDVSAPTPCTTVVYKIDLSWGNSKEVYAAALTALASGKPVAIEVAACTGWGSTIQSLFLKAS